MNIKRGGIYLASLDPATGFEISKTRLVIVISNDINNQYAGTVTVLPVTSNKTKKIYPFEYLLPKGCGNLHKESKAKADQIRTLDKRRLIKYIGNLNDNEVIAINKAIKIHLSL